MGVAGTAVAEEGTHQADRKVNRISIKRSYAVHAQSGLQTPSEQQIAQILINSKWSKIVSKRNLIFKLVGGLVVIGVIGFIAIQFVPVDKSNPPVVSEPKWNSPQTQMLAERACYDCHSNQTKWPWYSSVAPVSWLVSRHVQEGRAELNFSEWGVNNGGASEARESEEGEDEENEEHESGEGRQGEEREGVELEELIETIEEGEMPMAGYVRMHPEASLTDAEKQALIDGFKATFGSQAEGAMAQ